MHGLLRLVVKTSNTLDLTTLESELFHCLQPQDAYGLEKLATEELCKHYNKDFGIECRIGRFHNIYGPFGTWKGSSNTLAVVSTRRRRVFAVTPCASLSCRWKGEGTCGFLQEDSHLCR